MGELERIIRTGAIGIMLPANVENTNIGELALDPLWSKAEALNCPIILHPVLVGPAPRAAKFGLTQSTQYTFDTTLGIGSLLFSGVLDRFPNLTFVLSHGGGAFPYLAGRFDIMHERMDRAAQGDVAQQPPTAYVGGSPMTASFTAARRFDFSRSWLGVDRIMMGTDYSFPPADMSPLSTLKQAGFAQSEIEAIKVGNALRLFPQKNLPTSVRA